MIFLKNDKKLNWRCLLDQCTSCEVVYKILVAIATHLQGIVSPSFKPEK